MSRPKIHPDPTVLSVSLDRKELDRIDRSRHRLPYTLNHRTRSSYVRYALYVCAQLEPHLELIHALRGETDSTLSEFVGSLVRGAAGEMKDLPWVTEGTKHLIRRIK
jgi:hypothetical protein